MMAFQWGKGPAWGIVGRESLLIEESTSYGVHHLWKRLILGKPGGGRFLLLHLPWPVGLESLPLMRTTLRNVQRVNARQLIR
jgi:hypothetical protein